MKKKILKATYPERCIGCEMCVFECQHQATRTGLAGSLIRIFRNRGKDTVNFGVDIDPRVNKLNIDNIKDICPQGVFSVEEEDE